MSAMTQRRPGTLRSPPRGLCALAMVAGLLTGCGNGAEQGGGMGYGAPAPAGTGQAPTGAATGAEELTVLIDDLDFGVPDAVPAGATITVRNQDGVGHTVTADDGAFDVAVAPGEEVSFVAPQEAGDVAFSCTLHPAMTATLVVEGR